MLRIAHIAPDFLPRRGGAEVYLEQLIAALQRPGREQTVFQIDTGAVDPRVVNVPRFPGPLGRRRGFALWYFNPRLHFMRRALRRYDLLIVHYPFHVAGVWFHNRIIAISHGVEWRQPPRRLTHLLRRDIARWAVRRCRAVVANDTNFLREMGLPSQPGERPFEEHRPGVWFLPNAVDPARFANAPPDERFRPLNPILVPRNASEARGIHLAVEAFASYSQRHPETTLLLVGNLPVGGYARRLQSLIRAHGLGGRVLFAGNVDWEKMPGVYRAARMTLIPSLHTEGTSLAALESMAAGVATLSTDAGGLADLPTEHGAPTPESLAALMESVEERREEVAQRQQAIVRERFSLARWAEAWNRVVEQATN
ncbi:MAG: glycosyltransferase family 4 protein [Candidatus Sumerlaeota bacterium]|nr:glycosyltransferase family 4 protein [Candidatus Sumerlaeota bacterium]